MDLKLRGKVVLVAAGSAGLGLGVAKSVAREGAIVSIGSRDEKKLSEAKDALQKEGAESVLATHLDASKPDSINQWIEQSAQQFGRVDGLLVNAGGPPAGKFDDLNEAHWQQGFELTLMSAVRMIKAVLPIMKEGGGGSIVTVTSSSIKEPIDILLLSNVFRAGVASLVKSMSFDLAKDQIRINNLVPGRIDTERVRSLDTVKANRSGRPVEEQAAHEAERIPLGRYGTIDEFGNAGAFLLSPIASYITGSTVVVDGGLIRSLL